MIKSVLLRKKPNSWRASKNDDKTTTITTTIITTTTITTNDNTPNNNNNDNTPNKCKVYMPNHLQKKEVFLYYSLEKNPVITFQNPPV